jgi:hypothetical protein
MPRNLEFETKSSEVYLEETLRLQNIALCVFQREESLEVIATSLKRRQFYRIFTIVLSLLPSL